MSNFLSILLEKKVSTEVFYKCWILFAIQTDYIDKWLKQYPKFNGILEKLKLEGIVVEVNRKPQINIRSYNSSQYPELLGERTTMSLTTLNYQYQSLWKNQKGIGSNGKSYFLLDKDRTKVALSTFLEQNKDISYETIIKATEEYLSELDRDEKGHYLFAVKSSTFITGNARRDYLIEYCNHIDSMSKMQKNIKKDYKYQARGSTWSDI